MHVSKSIMDNGSKVSSHCQRREVQIWKGRNKNENWNIGMEL